MKRFFLLVVFTLIFFPVWAQVQFKTIVSKNTLSTNERLRVNFVISASGNFSQRNFTPPAFEGFQKIMGPSTSQEYSYINGKVSSKFVYGYVLQPVKSGKFTIAPASVIVDGKKYRTQPVEITVTKGSGTGTPQQGSTPNIISGGAKTNNITVEDKVDNAFLVAELTKQNPYVNEAVGLVYKLYIPQNYGVVNYNETGQPQFNGFWAQDVDRKISGPYPGEVNGKPYIFYILRKKLLFPQHSGKLPLKPLTLQIDLQVPVYRNFFGMKVPDYQVKRVKLTSGKKVLRVKALPEKNKPVDFSGAVGSFDFSVKADNNQVATGKPVNISVQVRGTGNLKLFDLPELKAPEGLEVYDPKHTEQVQTTFSGNKGVVKDDYIIVPNNPGKFIIPGLRFVYFDPKTGQYVTKTTQDLVLFATGENQSGNAPVSVNNNFNQNQSQSVDFRFIKDKAHFVHKKSKDFYKSQLFYALILLAFLTAFLAFAYQKYLSNKVYDAVYERRKRNKNLAQKFLKEAKKAIGQKELFYNRLEKALHNFIKARLNIDMAEMTRSNIRKILSEKGTDTGTIDKLIDLLDRCDMARYAPATTTKMEQDMADAEKLMNSF